MDIIGGLAAATQAIGLVKELRDIDRGVDEATFKLKIADLILVLADAKVALSEAKLTLQEKETTIGALKKSLEEAQHGEVCPKCRLGRMKLIETKKHFYGDLGDFGVEDWNFNCDNSNCDFTQMRMYDPHGAIPIAARKK
jgi:hypothetical protein